MQYGREVAVSFEIDVAEAYKPLFTTLFSSTLALYKIKACFSGLVQKRGDFDISHLLSPLVSHFFF